jgi:hypothetical protein
MHEYDTALKTLLAGPPILLWNRWRGAERRIARGTQRYRKGG